MHAKLLIVDDERLIRWSLKTRLQQAGYHVLVADSGRETLEALEHAVSLVLLDLKLPDADGLDLLREIHTRLPSCRIIMMTAHWTPEIAREARARGAVDVLPKPFTLDDLTSRIEAALV